VKLNADIILYELSQNTVCHKFSDSDNLPDFSHPEPLLEGTSMNQNVLYICAPEDIHEKMKEGTYICANKPDAIPDNPGISIISVEGVTMGKLFKLVTDVFHKYANWDNALLLALNDPEPLKSMAKCSRDIFGNTIIVVDRNFHLLVSPFEQNAEYISYNLSKEEDGFVPIEIVNHFKNDPYYNSLNNKRGAFHYTAELLPFQGLGVNLFSNDEYVARVGIFESHTRLGLLMDFF